MSLTDDFDRVRRSRPCPVCGSSKYCMTERPELWTDGKARVLCTKDESDQSWGEGEQIGWLHWVPQNAVSQDSRGNSTKPPKQTYRSVDAAARAALGGLKREYSRSTESRRDTYWDRDHNIVLIKLRLDTGEFDADTGKEIKRILPLSPYQGKWIIGDPRTDSPLPLFALPELLDRPDEQVVVVEGEKAAQALLDEGVLATTWHNPARPQGTDWSVLQGRDVVLLPDNDSKGEQAMERVGACLAGFPQTSLRRGHLPGLPPKGDAHDFLEALDGDKRAQLLDCLTPNKLQHIDVEGNSPFPIYFARDLDRLPKREMLIDGVLASKSLAALYGKSGSGKSFLALSIALSVQTGTTWMGHETVQGDVCWIAAEGFEEMRDRVWEWEQQEGVDGGDLMILDGSPAIVETGEVANVVESIRALSRNLSLIVIDTMADTFGDKDENSTRDMRLYLKGLKTFQSECPDTAILVVHHTGHEARRERGSSSFRAAMDIMLSVHQNDGVISLSKIKQRFRLSMNKLVFNLHEGERSCYLAVSTAPTAAEQNTLGHAADENRVLNTIRDHPGCSTKQLQEIAGFGRTKINQIKQRLKAAGRIETRGSGRKQQWHIVSEGSAEPSAESGGH